MPIKKHMDKKKIKTLASIFEPVQAYHKHEVHGIENIPDKGPCILVVNHSLATYDITLLLKRIFEEKDRVTRSLMDRWFFVIPQIAELVTSLGAVQGDPGAALKLLKEGELICVAPGGMRESLRPHNERYQIMWKKRKGFAKLAMLSGAPVVLAACPRADDIFEVYSSKLTSFFYDNFKLPFVPFRGIGPTIIPKPVKLVHFISKPIYPPKIAKDAEQDAAFKKQLDAFHAKILKSMKELMGEAIAYREDEQE
jgi:1-acyl-sn-glycerol-3-phosphate acyltransferase